MFSQITQRLAGHRAKRPRQLRNLTFLRIPMWDASLAITVDLAGEFFPSPKPEAIQVELDGGEGEREMFVLLGAQDGDAREFGV